MSELPKWLGALLARLLPRQKAQGDSASQFGRVAGNVTIVHLTQHLPAPTPEPMPPALEPARPVRAPGVANDEQRQVLQLIRRLPSSTATAVHDFMQREFGTRVVVHLQPAQLYRVRRYVETIIKAEQSKAANG